MVSLLFSFKLIALIYIVSGSRFPGTMNVDMSDIRTNLIPFPNMQFISSGLSPITVSIDKLKTHIPG